MTARGLGRALLTGLLVSATAASAWQIPTHVGITHRAIQRSTLDAWLRKNGLGDGLYEVLGLAKRPTTAGPIDDAALLEELATLDASLGASPDHGRQPALAWVLAGAALEGADMQRVRNHFVNPRTHRGLDEHARFADGKSTLDGARQGISTVRGLLAGGAFDGTGLRADVWVELERNPLSRPHFLDALYRAHTARSATERASWLARALVCVGSMLHVLQAVGDPAHAHGDFAVNYLAAGAPLARWVDARYGTATPPALQAGAARARLRSFFTSDDHSGLADQVARTYGSPGAPSGLPMRNPAEVADELLPRLAAESAALLDFLLRGSLQLSAARYEKGVLKIDLQVGSVPIGAGELELYEEEADGTRTRISSGHVAGGVSGVTLRSFSDDELPAGRRRIAVFRGLDGNGEPIVLAAPIGR